MWQMTPRPSPSAASSVVDVDLPEILGILKANYTNGTAEIYLSDEGRVLAIDAPETEKDRRNRVYVADIEEDDKTITFLINRGDANVADTAFINSATKSVRTVVPGKDESQGWSAHLVVAKKAKGNVHRAVYERMPHTSSSYTNALIRTLLERHAHNNGKYIYEKKVKKGRIYETEQRPYRPHLSIHKKPTETIKEDLKNGVLSSITLTATNTDFAGLDVANNIQSAEYKLVITPKNISKNKAAGFIESVFSWGKEHDFYEIQIKMAELPGGTSSSPRFLLEKEDALETLYVRSKRLDGFKSLLEQCYPKINKEIKEKMIELLNDNKKW
jgi:hypothetical protein